MQHRDRRLKRKPWAAVSLFVCSIAATALPLWHNAQPKPVVPRAGSEATLSPDEIVVDLRDDAAPADVAHVGVQAGLLLQPNSPHSSSAKLFRARLAPGQDRDTLLARLQADERVEAAEAEATFHLPEPITAQSKYFVRASREAPEAAPKTRGWKPNDPRFDEQWHLSMVGAEAAWQRSRGKGVIVAVIDTGVAVRDSARGKRCRDFAQTSWTPGYNFIENNDDTYDDVGHGTHVAGTIAESTNNGEGAAGLAYQASIMPLKVFGLNGYCTSADIADAVRFAVDRGAGVINMSLGGPMPSPVMHRAVQYARARGVLVVCSAGNGFGEPVGFPAAFDESLAISAVGPKSGIATYSSYGPEVSLAAPGGDMIAFGPQAGVLQNTFIPAEFGGSGDDYYFFQGTSMSAPHASAVAALVMAQGIRDAARVEDILLRSCLKREPQLKFGAGLLSAAGATRMAATFNRNALLFNVLVALGAALIFLGIRDTAERRAGLAVSFAFGALMPIVGVRFFGADALGNLLTFSAALPFVLFWEWERGFGSRLVSAICFGVAANICGALALDGIAPFTPSTYGLTAMPWMVANGVSALILGWLA
ncbi:MAG: serine protease, partial [Abditibacteriota bacterium]|nr:serine protease [Abditibacteriota bacterium]